MRGLLILLGALLVAPAFAADEEISFDDPALSARYEALIREVRCPLCLNESIADSKAPVAADLRREVHRMIAEGKSDREIKDFLSARYGDFVLYRPRVEPATWALWAGPGIFLVIGAFVFWRILSVRRRQPIEEDPPA